MRIHRLQARTRIDLGLVAPQPLRQLARSLGQAQRELRDGFKEGAGDDEDTPADKA